MFILGHVWIYSTGFESASDNGRQFQTRVTASELFIGPYNNGNGAVKYWSEVLESNCLGPRGKLTFSTSSDSLEGSATVFTAN